MPVDHPFPLSSFLISLESEGFRLTVKDCERIDAVLRTGGKWSLTRLRNVLLALLAKDLDQREAFQRCFDDFFDPELVSRGLEIDVDEVLKDIEDLKEKRLPAVQDEKETPLQQLPLHYRTRDHRHQPRDNCLHYEHEHHQSPS